MNCLMLSQKQIKNFIFPFSIFIGVIVLIIIVCLIYIIRTRKFIKENEEDDLESAE
ncbi:MAG: hypothetical protein IKE75_01095 [Bacilli bacterium]|nr:hypothetical protein [Bacilli bacterium]